MRYLDEVGLLALWNKLKAFINSKNDIIEIIDLTDESD